MPTNTRKIISVKSPKASSTFKLYNPRQQPGTIREPEKEFDKGERCDFVFQIPSHPLELYVELKGSKLDKALRQLANTIRLLNSELRPKQCIIVLWQGAPPRADTRRQNDKLAFEREHKCKLQWQTGHGSHRLS